ncbi:O-antigen ligase family protein [Ectothiorhodospira variabilis]|uniref:O-antigen ligase family protein n=1 Tax=Ectothiorhodospira variabilis TaxID=505694 RepID=UPI001EFAAFB2|nr:O-antigen ligase family protein [Ectothiorhodospira variabilis]MCG5493458.1 O-antigen ligase family protein [Ectothiorhodospira variabilis]MCG5496804.1 O-antigen ligase family protein [Ectothiorhodospira variabilis]MCG5502787.1 O-antigen ligase family protein [Ectothiorhodospira variabilis]MCG5506425.1 O-antigen ligase family protein [Ectothiorhodospira variabilis]
MHIKAFSAQDGQAPGFVRRQPWRAKVESWITKASVPALFLYFLAPLGSSFAYVGGAFLSVTLILTAFTNTRELIGHPLIATLAMISIYLVFSAIYATHHFPDNIGDIVTSLRAYLELILVGLGIGWYISRKPWLLFPLLLTAMIGLTTRIVLYVDWSSPVGWLQDYGRIGFGLSVIHYPLYSVPMAIGIIIFMRRLILKQDAVGLRIMTIILGYAVFLLICYTLILNQTRMVWIALLPILPVLAYAFMRDTRIPRVRARYSYAPAIIALLAFSALIVSQQDTLTQRLSAEDGALHSLATLKIDQLGERSIGLRFDMFQQGIENWAESPLLGKGVGAGAILPEHYSHMHNIAAHYLVEVGVIGVALTLVAILILLRALYHQYRSHNNTHDILTWLALSLVFSTIWLMGESKLWQMYVRAPFTILLGITIAAYFLNRRGESLSATISQSRSPKA